MRIPPINTGSRYKISLNAFSHCDFTSCNFLLLTENVIKENTTTVRLSLYYIHTHKKLHNFSFTLSSGSPRLFAATLWKNFPARQKIIALILQSHWIGFPCLVSPFKTELPHLPIFYAQNLAPAPISGIFLARGRQSALNHSAYTSIEAPVCLFRIRNFPFRIPDPNFFHPGSEFFPTRISDTHQRI